MVEGFQSVVLKRNTTYNLKMTSVNMDSGKVIKGTIIEGIGDDLIYGIATFLAVALNVFGALYYWYLRRGNQSIHPESQDAVNSTREQLRNTAPEITSRPEPTAPPLQEPSTSTHRTRREDMTCPICIASAQYAIQTNCGHIFCGQCMCTYWTHGSWIGAVRCPVCRQTVTTLLFNFSDEEQQDRSEEKSQVIRDINRYNRRFSGQPVPWLDYMWDLPTILRHLLNEFFSIGGLIWMFRLRIFVCFLAALIYLISPLDIIPEAAFGILGFLDDLFILFLLAIYMSILYRRYIAERAAHAQE